MTNDQRGAAGFEVHGPRPLERVAERRQVLRHRPVTDHAHRRRPQRGRAGSVRRPVGMGALVHRLARPWSPTPTSASSTSARRTTSMPSRRSPRSKPASTSRARSPSQARSPMPKRWWPQPRRPTARTFVWYNYRRVPAVALAHQLVAGGALGRIYHARACYLQSWGGPDTPLLWRFQGDVAGSGAHGDLNAHIIDAVRFVTGEEITVVEGAIEHTFIEERELLDGRCRWRDRRVGRSDRRREGREHRRRRGRCSSPGSAAAVSPLRGDPARDRLPQRQPVRDPR